MAYPQGPQAYPRRWRLYWPMDLWISHSVRAGVNKPIRNSSYFSWILFQITGPRLIDQNLGARQCILKLKKRQLYIVWCYGLFSANNELIDFIVIYFFSYNPLLLRGIISKSIWFENPGLGHAHQIRPRASQTYPTNAVNRVSYSFTPNPVFCNPQIDNKFNDNHQIT